MLREFKKWVDDRAEEFQQTGFRKAFHKPTSKTGAYLDKDSEKYVARITLWESLELQFEAMDVISGEQAIWEYNQVRDSDEVLTLNSAFIARLR